MKKIDTDVFIETSYPGVTLGAVTFSEGTYMIDAPPRPDDGRSWLAALRSKGTSSNRMLIHLDAHPDRTLGGRALESSVLAHEETAALFRRRPAIFKAQNECSGAEWETCSGLSGLRWLAPTLTFSQSAVLHGGQHEVVLELHPGPEPGAIWVILPEKQIVFVGDAVVPKQPPFLGHANIDAWVDALDLLLKKPYSEYTVISGRGGPVPEKQIRELRRFLKDVERRLGRLAKRKAPPQETAKLVPKLLSKYKYPGKRSEVYADRLQYGLLHYYRKHYHQASGGGSS